MGIEVLPFHGKSRTTHKDCRTHMNSALSRKDFLTIGLVGSLGTLSLPAKAQESGKFVALIVGVSTYKFGYQTLNAGGDARKIDAALRGLGYAEPFLLSNIVNKGAFVELLKEVLNGLNPEDTFLFFFAGHGSRRSQKDAAGKVLRDSQGRIREEEYLLFSDTEDSRFSDTALSISELEKELGGCVAQKRLFILDACRSTTDATKSRSGKLGFRDDTLKADYGKFRERLDAVARTKPDDFKGSVAAAILWSCSPGEKSYEDDKGGVFTAQLVSALTGGVRGVPTATELRQYVLTHMPTGLPGPQTPDLRGTGTVAVSPQPVAERADPEPRPNRDPNPRPDPNPRRGSRLTDYPALKAYIDSLRLIPAGTFQMGGTRYLVEEPVHSVTLSAFRMGATPVTVSIWKEYCAATGTKLPEAPRWGLLDDHPVVNVSWNDIMGSDGKGGFCAWASDIAGFRLTLPTEAQWEYACRGGQSGLEYPWGNSFDDSKLWCSKPTNRTSTAPVTRSSNIFRNAYGLTDMSGNVWQWCSDWYGSYSGSAQNDPTGPSSSSGNDRCLRGGSWIDDRPEYFRCAIRGKDIPFGRLNYLTCGFRLSTGPGSGSDVVDTPVLNTKQQDPSRFALILANQTYEKFPLTFVDNDASLMARTLTSLGFKVSTLVDGTVSTMRSKLIELNKNLSSKPGSIGLVYFSGHGLRVGGEDYFVPVNNGSIVSKSDARASCLSIANVLELSQGKQVSNLIAIFDSSREDPFTSDDAPQNCIGKSDLAIIGQVPFVAFATGVGQTATANGTNSLFTKVLSDELMIAGRTFEDVIIQTGYRVSSLSGGKQRPEYRGTCKQVLSKTL